MSDKMQKHMDVERKQKYLGGVFGKYKIIGLYPTKNVNKHYQYWAFCTGCGASRTMTIHDILRDGPKKCGHKNHFWREQKLRAVYNSMKARCFNKNNHAFKNYGGRGITVCEAWRFSPKAFEDWALTNGYKHGLTIDRIDNNGDYCPKNCRWITKEENSNRRNTVSKLKLFGEINSFAGWSKAAGMQRDWFYCTRARVGYDNAIARLTDKLKDRGWGCNEA